MVIGEEEIKQLYQTDRAVFKSFRKALDKLIKWLKSTIAQLSQDKAKREMRALNGDLELLEKKRELFNKALSEAAENFAKEQKTTAEVGGGKSSLKEYSQHQIDNWSQSKSIVIFESESQLSGFIDDAISGRNLGKKMYFGAIPKELANRIMQETGVDVENYNCTLRADEIRKILLKSHGDESKEAARGQRAVTKWDILNIPVVIQSPDTISLGQDTDGGKPSIVFSKQVNGKTTVVSYVSDKHLDLTVKTMYAWAKKGSLPTAADVKSPALTPEAVSGMASNKSIRDFDEKVNSKLSTKDTDYLAAVERGDMKTAQRMVDEAAQAAGYTDDVSWRMEHRAPNSKDDVSLLDLRESGLVPADYWERPEWYTYTPEERESFHKIKRAFEIADERQAKGTKRPVGIRVYRAVDKTKNKREDDFRNGDWVTPSYDYAVREGKENPDGYRIISHHAYLSDLYWDGNSIAELGYDDGEHYAYQDTKNNRKLLDPVTYDNYGDVIPLSKRFNKREFDVRYSKKDSEGNTLSAEQQEFFKNSKIRDENGNLLVVYHGTNKDFFEFNRHTLGTSSRGGAGTHYGFFFAEDK